jgi:predicted transcriptional regulator
MTKTNDSVDFACEMKNRMQEKQLSIRDLAKKCGIPMRSIKNYMDGKKEPNSFELGLITKVLEM